MISACTNAGENPGMCKYHAGPGLVKPIWMDHCEVWTSYKIDESSNEKSHKEDISHESICAVLFTTLLPFIAACPEEVPSITAEPAWNPYLVG